MEVDPPLQSSIILRCLVVIVMVKIVSGGEDACLTGKSKSMQSSCLRRLALNLIVKIVPEGKVPCLQGRAGACVTLDECWVAGSIRASAAAANQLAESRLDPQPQLCRNSC